LQVWFLAVPSDDVHQMTGRETNMHGVAHFTAAAKLLLSALVVAAGQTLAQSDPLPSWNDGARKKAIVDLVRATTQGNAKFVPAGYPSSKECAK
jgi:hypothetical protein